MSEWALSGTLGLIGLQTLLMTVDEMYFHRRRGLERLEAWGHAFDTALFLAAIAVPAFFAPTGTATLAYVALAVLSTLVVTKDEWLHAKSCEPGEHWVHSLLFALHGPLLIGIGWCWHHGLGSFWLKALPVLVGGWGLLQLFYWTHAHASFEPRNGEQRVLRRPRRALVSR